MMRLAFGDRRLKVVTIGDKLREDSTSLPALCRTLATSEDTVA
ncbi:MAG: hypothetical protein AVDCRST_MAG58-1886 [uncultured Rubrobacteraceae bacterium]|uniref:Uncharacterized protein n=1 Tax=uncultured Rubrobacteraceae bacterium TaxID=349277 RepID=A0A6J4R4R7_9ACTN|nr:MAG: hypothetical protein AVDCRST_MAG58-1886 [uncultured Rubrobacteraceae bacterium]